MDSDLIYEIYGIFEENSDGKKSRSYIYWLIGNKINEYTSKRPMRKDITGALANQLEESLSLRVGFSARNLRYMQKFAQTMPHPAHWDEATRKRQWTDHVKAMSQTEGAAKRGRKPRTSTANAIDQPIRTAPTRRDLGLLAEAEADRAPLTDTHVVALASALLSRIPGVSLIGLDRHLSQRNLLEAVSLHVVSQASEIDLVLVVHEGSFKAVELQRIHRDVVQKYPWRTIVFMQFNVGTKMHCIANTNDLKFRQLAKRVFIEARRVFVCIKS
ncbi:hypothetical protein GCM10010842_34900 [Deinococcus daejeonensis]|uniref:YhcG N-terminal domain-containing protein n=2 Tax=Deinococcus daejeonensis TaxID=1007098 RepID=A0ABQ2JHL1_9DEIO|nr:hypothetical protein GCM10010842_34900 [Deinococcus daejeonensis]